MNNINATLSGDKRKTAITPLAMMEEQAKLQYKLIEQAALQKFNAADSYKYSQKNPNVNIVPPDPGISDPIIHEPSIDFCLNENNSVVFTL